MESQPITIERVPFASLGDEWHEMARAGFHADYAGVSEMYGGGADSAEAKIALMHRWGGGIQAWTARDAGRLVGLLTGNLDGDELTIYDFFVDGAYQRPVSYTHLDVYKRQGRHRSGRRQSDLLSARWGGAAVGVGTGRRSVQP